MEVSIITFSSIWSNNNDIQQLSLSGTFYTYPYKIIGDNKGKFEEYKIMKAACDT